MVMEAMARAVVNECGLLCLSRASEEAVEVASPIGLQLVCSAFLILSGNVVLPTKRLRSLFAYCWLCLC